MILNIELSWRYLSLIQLWSSFMNSPFKKAVDPFFNVSLSHGVEMRQVIYPWVAWLSSEKNIVCHVKVAKEETATMGPKILLFRIQIFSNYLVYFETWTQIAYSESVTGCIKLAFVRVKWHKWVLKQDTADKRDHFS